MGLKQSVIQSFALVTQLGISILVPILLCAFLGNWLGEKFSIPVFIPLLLLGVLAGIRNAYQLVKGVRNEMKDGK